MADYIGGVCQNGCQGSSVERVHVRELVCDASPSIAPRPIHPNIHRKQVYVRSRSDPESRSSRDIACTHDFEVGGGVDEFVGGWLTTSTPADAHSVGKSRKRPRKPFRSVMICPMFQAVPPAGINLLFQDTTDVDNQLVNACAGCSRKLR